MEGSQQFLIGYSGTALREDPVEPASINIKHWLSSAGKPESDIPAGNGIFCTESAYSVPIDMALSYLILSD